VPVTALLKVMVCELGTVNGWPLLASPPAVSTTLPVVAPAGTTATTDLSDALLTVAAVPLNVTVGVVANPAIKLVPVIVTEVPAAPSVGDRLVIAGISVKAAVLLATPPTVTITGSLPATPFPVATATIDVLLQLVIVATYPLNVTVLVPCVAPKFVPVIVTGLPTAAEVGDKLLMMGYAEGVTVNATPLLATPATVTTTLPVVAPAGTTATIDVLLELVIEAAVPLNFTLGKFNPLMKFVPVIVTEAPTTPEVADRLVIAGAV
jgi:hypothetical protein